MKRRFILGSACAILVATSGCLDVLSRTTEVPVEIYNRTSSSKQVSVTVINASEREESPDHQLEMGPDTREEITAIVRRGGSSTIIVSTDSGAETEIAISQSTQSMQIEILESGEITYEAVSS